MEGVQTLEAICQETFDSTFKHCGNTYYRQICVDIQRNQIEMAKLKLLTHYVELKRKVTSGPN